MNPKYRREEAQVRWWFSASDIDGQTRPGSYLYSPSGVRFLVVEPYKVPPAVPAVAGEVEAISADFSQTGINKPSTWERLETDPERGAAAIVATLKSQYKGAQLALSSLDGAELTEKGQALRSIWAAEKSRNINDALKASKLTAAAFSLPSVDPPPSSDRGPAQVVPGTKPPGTEPSKGGASVDWWMVAKAALAVGLTVAVVSAVSSPGDDEEY